jgi:hypothetical protein
MNWLRLLATGLVVLGVFALGHRVWVLRDALLFDDAAFMAGLERELQMGDLGAAVRYCRAAGHAPLPVVVVNGLGHANLPREDVRDAVARAQDVATVALHSGEPWPLWFGAGGLVLALVGWAGERRRGEPRASTTILGAACAVIALHLGLGLRTEAIEASLRTNSATFLQWLDRQRPNPLGDVVVSDGRLPPSNLPPSEPEIAGPLLQVTALTGAEAGKVWTFSSDSVQIGSGASADVRLTDPEVAEVHAVASRDSEAWRLIDLGSSSGTWVGAEKLSAQATIDAPTTVRMGPVELRLEPLPGD